MGFVNALYAEQTSPDEIIVFLLLGTLVTLLIAFSAYALLLMLLSRVRMRNAYSLRKLLLPSNEQLKNYAAEYTLSLLTALLLGLTVSVKHVTVDAVLEQDLRTIGHEAIQSVLQVGHVSKEDLIEAGATPQTAEQFAAWLVDGVAETTVIQADAIVRPLLEAGLNDSASRVVRLIVDDPHTDIDSVMLQRALLISAIVLLFGYVGWFGYKRWREAQDEEFSEPNYANLLKRLTLPAVCIPLLLASAVALNDKERIVDSVVAAAEYREPPGKRSLGKAIVTKVRASGGLNEEQYRSEFNVLGERLDMVEYRIEDMGTRLTGSAADLNSAVNDIAGNHAQIRALRDELDKLLREWAATEEKLSAGFRQSQAISRQAMVLAENNGGDIKKLQGELERLERELQRVSRLVTKTDDKKGILLVSNAAGSPAYRINSFRSSQRRVRRIDSGSRLGIHLLSPGAYTIIASDGRSQSVEIKADSAETVLFPYLVQ